MRYKYSPIFRARQQENLVLGSFDFGNRIMPIVEIIKESDRVLRNGTPQIYIDRYKALFRSIQARRVILDLPIYLRIRNNTKAETIRFYRTTISNLRNRINYYRNFIDLNDKITPVISSLLDIAGQNNTIRTQFDQLNQDFDKIAFRIFSNDIDTAIPEIINCVRESDIIIYDIDTSSITNPLVIANSNRIHREFSTNHKILVRSAINQEIQNVDLLHDRIVAEADNSLLTNFRRVPLRYNSFGDFAGIKKDDITDGGSISPGFIIFDPIANVFYGYRGRSRILSEFETTIVPDVLNSNFMSNLINNHNEFVTDNLGYDTLVNINNRQESGRSQAKFKRISIEHYLHCVKTLIDQGSV